MVIPIERCKFLNGDEWAPGPCESINELKTKIACKFDKFATEVTLLHPRTSKVLTQVDAVFVEELPPTVDAVFQNIKFDRHMWEDTLMIHSSVSDDEGLERAMRRMEKNEEGNHDDMGRIPLHAKIFAGELVLQMVKKNDGHDIASCSSTAQSMISLLRIRADVNCADDLQRTSLHYAAERGDDEYCEDANMDVEDVMDQSSSAPLVVADSRKCRLGKSGQHTHACCVIRGYSDVVCLLLSAEADVHRQDFSGETSLHRAAIYGRSSTMGLLLRARAEVNKKSYSGSTSLHQATIHAHTESIRSLLLAHADVDANTLRGRTSLHQAAAYSDVTIIRMLLDARAHVEARDWQGCTSLHFAAGRDAQELMEVLLQAESGCSKDKLHRAPSLNATDVYGRTCLHRAALRGYDQMVAYLVLRAHAELDIRDERGRTALHWAAMQGYADTVKVLIRGKAAVVRSIAKKRALM